MKMLNKKSKRVFFLTTYTFFLLFFLWKWPCKRLVNKFIPMGPVCTDVAKRITAPDYSKTVLLIRRNALFDLNFLVEIKEKLSYKTLHRSRDFLPNLTADWNEQIVWSDDSSLIVLKVDDVSNNYEKYMWAYDFKNKKEYLDKEKIMEILNYRNTFKE